MKKTLTFLFSLFCLLSISNRSMAASVDTLSIQSKAMDKKIKTVVILPQSYTKNQQYPVLYLLHGYSGNYSNWVNSVPLVKKLVDDYNMIVICPDGGFGSWYWDVSGDKNYQYETFVANELVHYVDQHFSTIANKNGRAISGLSMGGHGALYLAIRHQDIYGSAGSTAGGVDFRPFQNNWQIKDRLGEYGSNIQKWDDHTVMNLIPLIKPNALKLIVDCGEQDFFFEVNKAFHEKLNYFKIDHTFISAPGAHNWDYWSKSIRYQMAFFDDFFKNQKIK